MKRGLVSYSSSDESNVEESRSDLTTKLALLAPPTKKRKLPPLSASLLPTVPVDNPAEHQGRIRSFPHVEGQYATYIYVPLVLDPGEALYNLVTEMVCKAREEVKGLWAIGEVEDNELGSDIVRPSRRSAGEHSKTMANLELHISLSLPILLRAHQREEFKQAVRRVAQSVPPFDASFAALNELTNDESTRTFLAMEVGAGHIELRHILDLLTPTLRSLRQKEFYTDPKFHASIAWALLDHPKSPRPKTCPPFMTTSSVNIPSKSCVDPQCSTPIDLTDLSSPPDSFRRITCFPPSLVPSLNAMYAERLSTARTGGFLVDRVAVRIGKEVVGWSLMG
ncbi:hypothetical protein V8B97DRAFT_2049766 [Scleroderma yunnanense]